MKQDTIHQARRARTALAVCLGAAVPLAVVGVGGATATAKTSKASSRTSAHSAASLGRRHCSAPKYPRRSGRSLDLTTFHLSCSTGRRLALAHYRCRVKRGGALGRCSESKNKRILGYRCKEQRLINRGYYDGRVQCERGNHTAVYIYRQKSSKLRG